MFTIEVWSDASEGASKLYLRSCSTSGTARMLANEAKGRGHFVVIATPEGDAFVG